MCRLSFSWLSAGCASRGRGRGAGLSHASHSHRRRTSAILRAGSRRPRARAEAHRILGPAGHRRQSRRRERDHRRRDGRESEAGRLYAAPRRAERDHGQSVRLQEDALRPGARSRAGHADCDQHVRRRRHASLPVNSIKQLVALAKSRPDQLTYASAGIGNLTHLAGELFSQAAGVKMLHVPYKGTTPAQVDVMSGQAALMFVSMRGIAEHVAAKKARLLATMGDKRDPGLSRRADAGGARVSGRGRDRMERPARAGRYAAGDRQQALARNRTPSRAFPNFAIAWRASAPIRRRARRKRSRRSSRRKPRSGRK